MATQSGSDDDGINAQVSQIDPWTVSGPVDYMKLLNKFGTSPINGELLVRWETITKIPLHHFLRRGLVFSHQDLEQILSQKEKGNPIYLYTGRGPSSNIMHLGHLVPFQFVKYLQDALDAVVIIQMSDDEKFFFKNGKLEEFRKYSYQNAKDIIACGFDLNKTYIFSNLEAMGNDLYYNNVKIMKAVTGNQIEGIYGLNLSNNIGQLVWPCFQSGPAFSTSFKDIFGDKPIFCLASMAIDQSPYFRMARDVHKKLGCPKPAVIHSKFLPSLNKSDGKMSSSSNDPTTLFLDMNVRHVKKIINKYAFSGGRDTIELHRQYGGNINIDICYQYLTFFLESDRELKRIAESYSSGEMSSGELKELTSNVISNVIKLHQDNKSKVTDEVVAQYFVRDRKFDLTSETVTKKTTQYLENQYVDYDNYGINFDLTFGYKPKGEPPTVEKKCKYNNKMFRMFSVIMVFLIFAYFFGPISVEL